MPPSLPSAQILSPSEFRIFAVLRTGPLTIREIGQALARQDPNFSQAHNTVGTLLQRMTKKGYVAQEEQEHRAKLYRAVLPYELVLQRQVEYFLDSFMLTSPQDLRVIIDSTLSRLAPLTAQNKT
jgi:predicted transcriptional regulator